MPIRDDQYELPGDRVEDDDAIIGEVPLPPPSTPADVAAAHPGPIDADDPLIDQPLGGLVPNDPISEDIPDRNFNQSPHDPAATGNRTEQPASSSTTPEVPRPPDWEPPVTQ